MTFIFDGVTLQTSHPGIGFRILFITFILLSNRMPQKGQYHFQLNYQSYSNWSTPWKSYSSLDPLWGAQAGTYRRALVSHQWKAGFNPGLVPKVDFVLVLASLRGFISGSFHFLSYLKNYSRLYGRYVSSVWGGVGNMNHVSVTKTGCGQDILKISKFIRPFIITVLMWRPYTR